MDIKQYTDEKYIPMSDLSSLGDDFIKSTIEYRRTFMEVVQVNDFEFANIVETPKLLKRRYSKNVELKNLIELDAKDNDYILELSLRIVKGGCKEYISDEMRKMIIKKYKINNFDLTIVTNWIVDNIELFKEEQVDDIGYEIPELTINDIKFIKKYNKINQHYSINDYTKLNKSSYETGRKALEKLKQLKLYTKNKLGKKFVYQPTNKLKEIMKGGTYGN